MSCQICGAEMTNACRREALKRKLSDLLEFCDAHDLPAVVSVEDQGFLYGNMNKILNQYAKSLHECRSINQSPIYLAVIILWTLAADELNSKVDDEAVHEFVRETIDKVKLAFNKDGQND